MQHADRPLLLPLLLLLLHFCSLRALLHQIAPLSKHHTGSAELTAVAAMADCEGKDSSSDAPTQQCSGANAMEVSDSKQHTTAAAATRTATTATTAAKRSKQQALILGGNPLNDADTLSTVLSFVGGRQWAFIAAVNVFGAQSTWDWSTVSV